jgi:predicted RNA-binding protein
MNILVLTYWSLNEPLTRSAVLPYLDMIAASNNERDTQFVLFTLEKGRYQLSEEENDQVQQQFLRQNVTALFPIRTKSRPQLVEELVAFAKDHSGEKHRRHSCLW